MNNSLRNIFNFIAKYNLRCMVERCGYKDGFIITLYKQGLNRSDFISDDKLLDFGEDYLLSIIEDMVHKLLEEEQKCFKAAEQFKKQNIMVEIK